METVEELRAAVFRDPRLVAEVGSRLASEARAAGDDAALSGVLAVLGRARRALGEIDLAEADLLAAIEAAGDRDELAADAHLGIAGVLSLAGRPADAFAHLDSAHARGSERIRAYAALQRAAVEQRIGHMRQALASYASALPVLHALAANLDIAMVLLNRGVIHTQSGDCDAALADLTEASERYAKEGHDYGVAQADHGLGWAHARRGDLPLALSYLDRAAQRFRTLGHTALEVDVDRVEALLAAGLFTPALELAIDTARRLGAAGNHSLAAETWLLCARASLLDGDHATAARYAARARSRFEEQGSVGWERAARLELVRCGADPDTTAGGLRALAGELDEVGNARGAVTALALAGVAAADAGDLPLAAELSTACASRASRLGIFEVRMLATYARARCAVARGEPATATRLVRSGLRGLHRHRTSLAATDARASVAVHASQLAGLGLRLARRTGSAAKLLEWTELARAGRGQLPPPQPPDDPALAAELVALRAAVSELRKRESAGQDPTDLLRTQRDLERAIHARQLRTAGQSAAGGGQVAGVARLREALAGGCLVSLADIDDQLVGVRVGGGRTRLADLGPAGELTGAADSAVAALRSLLAPRRTAGAELAGRLRRAVRILDRGLAGLLAGDGPVVLVVPAALHAVPWRLLPVLAGRPVVVAPSASWWLAAQAEAGPPAAGPPLVAAGPRLVEADAEAYGVAGCHPDAAALAGAAATTGAVLAALPTARLAHLACHARIRHDNALWSSLELADGPLSVYDVERLPRTPPLVVLSGCETGLGVRAGDELLGLAAALLRHRTRCLVASVCALPDTTATRETMIALHRRLGAGATAPAALAELTAGGVDDEGSLLAASLGCFGAY